jgi:uncharacterized protein YyaL (SSP411 family)
MPNRLQNQRSPYLLQHAENPVDWYPWGEEAFEKARREGKPVFLSIGYATCHWCHVMARESFESPEVARILNRSFVPVKVDREERPDVDAVYMEACVALNGSGGWPLTLLLTPEGEPFFAGTYLPRENRGRQLGLIPLLQVVEGKWKRDRQSLEKTAGELSEFLRRERPLQPGEIDPELPGRAYEQLKGIFDEEFGGFGTAPKFPAPQNLLFLLRYAALTGEKEARRMAEKTLQQMARGGIYDQIGGGFARYSTDREWLAPHFEKTLYDNALLALCYTEAWQEGRFALYRRIAEETLDYCLRELKSPCGGFCSGQDADSDGEEGKYYLLTPELVKAVLGEDEGRHFGECYDITPEGNFQGKSIPNLLLNQRWNLIPEGYGEYRQRLREDRAKRVSLRRDDKLLTAWNGMLLVALSRAAKAFGREDYARAARELCAFLLEKAGGAEPEKLRAVSYEGESAFLPAQLDDYAFAALGLLEAYALDRDASLLLAAEGLAREIPAHFTAPGGGFYRSTDRGEKLLKRPMECYDGALPSGNSAALVLFDLLRRLSGKEEWRESAQRQGAFLCAAVKEAPMAGAYGLLGLMGQLYPTKELVAALTGEESRMLSSIESRFDPRITILVKKPGDQKLAEFAPFTANYGPVEGKNAFYLCENCACALPFTE